MKVNSDYFQDPRQAFRNPHQVLMTLKYSSPGPAGATAMDHIQYYKEKTGPRLISYGHAMNRPTICIVLDVTDDEDFEEIVFNDPALISGELEIDTIVPFFPLLPGSIDTP